MENGEKLKNLSNEGQLLALSKLYERKLKELLIYISIPRYKPYLCYEDFFDDIGKVSMYINAVSDEMETNDNNLNPNNTEKETDTETENGKETKKKQKTDNEKDQENKQGKGNEKTEIKTDKKVYLNNLILYLSSLIVSNLSYVELMDICINRREFNKCGFYACNNKFINEPGGTIYALNTQQKVIQRRDYVSMFCSAECMNNNLSVIKLIKKEGKTEREKRDIKQKCTLIHILFQIFFPFFKFHDIKILFNNLNRIKIENGKVRLLKEEQNMETNDDKPNDENVATDISNVAVNQKKQKFVHRNNGMNLNNINFPIIENMNGMEYYDYKDQNVNIGAMGDTNYTENLIISPNTPVYKTGVISDSQKMEEKQYQNLLIHSNDKLEIVDDKQTENLINAINNIVLTRGREIIQQNDLNKQHLENEMEQQDDDIMSYKILGQSNKKGILKCDKITDQYDAIKKKRKVHFNVKEIQCFKFLKNETIDCFFIEHIDNTVKESFAESGIINKRNIRRNNNTRVFNYCGKTYILSNQPTCDYYALNYASNQNNQSLYSPVKEEEDDLYLSQLFDEQNGNMVRCEDEKKTKQLKTEEKKTVKKNENKKKEVKSQKEKKENINSFSDNQQNQLKTVPLKNTLRPNKCDTSEKKEKVENKNSSKNFLHNNQTKRKCKNKNEDSPLAWKDWKLSPHIFDSGKIDETTYDQDSKNKIKKVKNKSGNNDKGNNNEKDMKSDLESEMESGMEGDTETDLGANNQKTNLKPVSTYKQMKPDDNNISSKEKKRKREIQGEWNYYCDSSIFISPQVINFDYEQKGTINDASKRINEINNAMAKKKENRKVILLNRKNKPGEKEVTKMQEDVANSVEEERLALPEIGGANEGRQKKNNKKEIETLEREVLERERMEREIMEREILEREALEREAIEREALEREAIEREALDRKVEKTGDNEEKKDEQYVKQSIIVGEKKRREGETVEEKRRNVEEESCLKKTDNEIEINGIEEMNEKEHEQLLMEKKRKIWEQYYSHLCIPNGFCSNYYNCDNESTEEMESDEYNENELELVEDRKKVNHSSEVNKKRAIHQNGIQQDGIQQNGEHLKKDENKKYNEKYKKKKEESNNNEYLYNCGDKSIYKELSLFALLWDFLSSSVSKYTTQFFIRKKFEFPQALNETEHKRKTEFLKKVSLYMPKCFHPISSLILDVISTFSFQRPIFPFRKSFYKCLTYLIVHAFVQLREEWLPVGGDIDYKVKAKNYLVKKKKLEHDSLKELAQIFINAIIY